MAEAVYVLCAVTSVACAVMLFRGYARSKARLLMWSGVCFAGLAMNNALLFIDKVLYPEAVLEMASISFGLWRSVAAFVGLAALLFGLIWDSE
jgi:hypothetical protein